MLNSERKFGAVNSPYRDGVDQTVELQSQFQSLVERTRNIMAITMHHFPNAVMLATLAYADSNGDVEEGKWLLCILTAIVVIVYERRRHAMQKHFRDVLKYKTRIVDKNIDTAAEKGFLSTTNLNPHQFKIEDSAIFIRVFPIMFGLMGIAFELGKASDENALLVLVGIEVAILTFFTTCTIYSMTVRKEFNEGIKKFAKHVVPEIQPLSGVRVALATVEAPIADVEGDEEIERRRREG